MQILSKGNIVDLYESLVTKNESLLSQEILNFPNNRFFKSEYIRSLFNNFSDFDDLEKLLLADINSYLPGDILTKVDRASMAVGFETRAPFLDHNVAEFAFSLSSNYKIRRKIFQKLQNGVLEKF